MKRISIIYKIIAFLLVFAFVFQTMEDINSHTYGTGIYNIHGPHSCMVIGSAAHTNLNCNY